MLTFQSSQHILHGLDFSCIYIDNVFVESSSEDEHTKHLEIFSNLRAAINPSKFGKTKLTFLDHHINATGTSHSSKTVAILQFPVPSNMKGL